VINNTLGTHIQGASVDNCAKSIRDDLEANALFLSNDSESLLFVSCDLAGLLPEFVNPAREAIEKATGLPSRNIIIAGTHTHSGPSVIPTNYLKPMDTDYLDRLQTWLVELARDAVDSACPGKIGWGLGNAQVGYNRRCCWADGGHTMHGDTKRENFTGLEGPDDSRHLAIFAEDADKKLIAVLHNNTSHPTCFYGEDFYSADFPGAARKYLREVLGTIPVLFFNGAFGDISIENMLSPCPRGETREQKMVRAGHLVAGETFRLLHEAEFYDNPTFIHTYEDLSIPVRLPDAKRLEWAHKLLARVDAGEDCNKWDRMFAYGISLLHKNFSGNPMDILPIHAIRIGDVALVTQPCELYCQFGLDIKRRSPAPYTAVCGITDGYNGYCPTTSGILGGGYSGEPINWCRLAPDAGYRIVDVAARLLHKLWQSEPLTKTSII